MAARNERLGEIMLEKGLVDQEGLTRALKSQEVMGGRLGTALVDMKLVTISTVSACLSYQRGVPDATRDALLSVKDDTIALLSRKQCSRHKVLPLKKEGKVLHLAMRDPQALDVIDDIAFSVGCTVKPYVIAEARLFLYMEIFYDVPRERRFAAFRDLDQVATSKPRKRGTKRSLFRLPGKGPKVVKRQAETNEHTPPVMTTPPPVPADAPVEEEMPAPRAMDELDLVALDSYTSPQSIEQQVITSTSMEPVPEPVSEDQSRIPTQVTAYPEPPPGEAPLAEGDTLFVSAEEGDEAAPPLARSEYHDVPLEPALPSPKSRVERELDSMSETAEMFPISEEELLAPKPAAPPSHGTDTDYPVAEPHPELTNREELAESEPATGTDQGYAAVQNEPAEYEPTEFEEPEEFEEPVRPPSRIRPGIPVAKVEPATEPELESESDDEGFTGFSFEMDDGEDGPEPADAAAPAPHGHDVGPEPAPEQASEEEDRGDADLVKDAAGSEELSEDDLDPLADADSEIDEFSGDELTGGIEGISTPEDAIRHLGRSMVRDDITRVLVSPFLSGTNLSILFLVRQGNFMALRASGSGARDEEIRAMVVSLANPSLLQRAYKQKTVLRAPAESDPLQQMISGHLRVGVPEEVCVAPVILAGRVVNVLCIQSRPGCRFSKEAIEQVQHVCEQASAAYKRLIHKNKK